MPYRVCSNPGCPNLTDAGGRCPTCQTQADRARGTATQRGYGRTHRTRFRPTVLAQAGHVCQLRLPDCTGIATVADHYPTSRRDLVAQGLDPDDPQYGRALCKSCHDKETARAQPGGWHAATWSPKGRAGGPQRPSS